MTNHSTSHSNRNLLALQKPVVLVGLMGAGKSTIGRRLARDIGLEFIDSDEEISEAAGCTVSDIFEIYGEGKFRDLEQRVMLRLLSQPPAVIATGGGAFMNTEIREATLQSAIAIWLRADIEVLIDRVARRNTRPLLQQGDKREILTRLMAERHPVYEQAHMAVNSGKGPHELVVAEIITQLTARKGQNQ